MKQISILTCPAELSQPNLHLTMQPKGSSSDLLFDDQWEVSIMKSPQVWDTTASWANIKIAIVDNRVQLNHSDRIYNMVPEFDTTAGGEINIDFSGARFPERMEMLSEQSGMPVNSISMKNINVIRDNILRINVKELPRGVYYLHLFEDSSKDKVQKIRIVLK